MVRTRILAVLFFSLILALTFACAKKKTLAPAVEEKPVVEEVAEEAPVAAEEPAVAETKSGAPMCEDVFFDYDKYSLKAEAKATLEMNAKALKAQSVPVIIEGHCDERGTEDYNMALGEKRAKAAMDYLVSLGVSAGTITVISYGESRPFDPGKGEAAWAKNRRAHFVTKQ